MYDYGFQVYLDKVICRDTESLLSSDKFALVGAVFTDLEVTGFAMPMMRINNGETRSFPNDLRHVFDGSSSTPRIGISLKAWDLDQNNSWLENKDDAMNVARSISTHLNGAGTAINTVAQGIEAVVDQFVSWDKNDLLGNYNEWIDVDTLVGSTTWKTLTIHFSRGTKESYSGWDYSIDLIIACTFSPSIFGTGEIPPPPDKQPLQKSHINSWIGAWEGEGVQAYIDPAGLSPYLKVTINEQVDGKTVTTTSEHVTLARLFIGLTSTTATKLAVGQANPSPGTSISASNVLTASLVRYQAHSDRVVSQEVLVGSHASPAATSQDEGRAIAYQQVQLKGDYIVLKNGATLEIYNMVSRGQVIGQALRYRNPTSVFLSALVSGVDVFLHRKVRLG